MASKPTVSCMDLTREQLKCFSSEHQETFLSAKIRGVFDYFINRKFVENVTPAVGRKFEKIQVLYYVYEGEDPGSKDVLNRTLVLALANIYSTNTSEKAAPDLFSLVGSLVTMLVAFSTKNDLKNSAIVAMADTYNINLRKEPILTKEELDRNSDRIWKVIRSNFMDDNIKNASGRIISISMVYLILVARKLTDYSRLKWFKASLDSIYSVLEIKTARIIMPPSLDSCLGVYQVASANFHVRKTIVNWIRALAEEPKGEFRRGWIYVRNNLRFAEMEYIPMILQHILEDNPEILMFPELSGEHLAMKNAMTYLASFPMFEFPYVKLTEDPENLYVLRSKNFPHHISAAYAIAEMTTGNISNHQVTGNNPMQNFQNRVKDYVRSKSVFTSKEAGKLVNE